MGRGRTKSVSAFQAMLFLLVGFGLSAAPWAGKAGEPADQAPTTSPGPAKGADPQTPDAQSVHRSLGGSSRRSGNPPGATLGSLGRSSTSLFGLMSEGRSFAYVFDRSGSMGGSGRVALAAAKDELIASLENLESVQRFQIIFYNENPVIFNPTGQPGKLAFATEANKNHARAFINSINADGGTGHEEALKLAIRLRPDVIFFLTDAGDPQLDPEQLQRIRRWAAGIKLNVIEFGQGPGPEGDNFLKQLARDNEGQYTYIDISTGYHGPRM